MKRFKITYHQKFNGETLTESYEVSVWSTAELIEIEQRLHEDPNVIYVETEAVRYD